MILYATSGTTGAITFTQATNITGTAADVKLIAVEAAKAIGDANNISYTVDDPTVTIPAQLHKQPT